MIRINFFGDIVAPSVNDVRLSDKLSMAIADADFNVINLEAPCLPPQSLSSTNKSGPVLYQDSNTPSWIESHGFNIVSLANNHIMDYGKAGLVDTMVKFKTAWTIGAGNWNSAYQPLIVEKGGVKIGFLALAHYEFGMLADKWDDRYSYGVAWINHPAVDKIIVEVKKKVDYLFIYAHAGVEHINQPLPEWRDRYRSLIDLGCDGVIASHPHIVQGWEWYNNSPILYSLGNFYFPKKNRKPDSWYISILPTITLSEKGSIALAVNSLKFDNNYIDFVESNENNDNLMKLNNILNNEIEYLAYINKKCFDLLPLYDYLFESSGYINNLTVKKCMFDIARKIRGKSYMSVHLINNLRCESHRWCISRGLKNRDGYQ